MDDVKSYLCSFETDLNKFDACLGMRRNWSLKLLTNYKPNMLNGAKMTANGVGNIIIMAIIIITTIIIIIAIKKMTIIIIIIIIIIIDAMKL